MNNLLVSFVGGLFSLISLFVLCYCVVIFFKYIITLLKPIKKQQESPELERTNIPRKKHRKPSTIRSIEIDPNEIDRIYVKKIS